MSNVLDLILGVSFALISTFMFNLGIVYQKKGVEEIGELKLSDTKSFINMIKSKTWLLGMSLGVFGALPYMLSQDFLGVALAQPLQGIGIIVLAYFAVKWLKEPLKPSEKIGVALLLGSVAFIILGWVSNVQVNIFDPVIIPPLILFYSIFLILIGITFILYKVSKKGIPQIIAINAGLWFGIGAISSQLAVEGLLGPLLRIIIPSIPGPTQINWALGLFGLLFITLGNLFATLFVQIAYQKGQAVSVVPIINTGNLLIPIFGGILIFGQIIGNIFFFIPGVVLMFIGVTLLARIQGELQKKEE